MIKKTKNYTKTPSTVIYFDLDQLACDVACSKRLRDGENKK